MLSGFWILLKSGKNAMLPIMKDRNWFSSFSKNKRIRNV